MTARASLSRRRQQHLNIVVVEVCGALGGTRTPTLLRTATSRQRVYQFRHERWKKAWADRPAGLTGADVTNLWGGNKGRTAFPYRRSGGIYRRSGERGSICLTSTAIRLRSTITEPLAIGRLLARILTSSCSVASSSMIAPRLRRIT